MPLEIYHPGNLSQTNRKPPISTVSEAVTVRPPHVEFQGIYSSYSAPHFGTYSRASFFLAVKVKALSSHMIYVHPSILTSQVVSNVDGSDHKKNYSIVFCCCFPCPELLAPTSQICGLVYLL